MSVVAGWYPVMDRYDIPRRMVVACEATDLKQKQREEQNQKTMADGRDGIVDALYGHSSCINLEVRTVDARRR